MPLFVGRTQWCVSTISRAAAAYCPSVWLYKSPEPIVATCSSAAKAIRITSNAWRVGGGGSAGGSSRVCSRLRLRAPAVIDYVFCQKLELAIRAATRRNHRRDTLPSAQVDEAVFLLASRSVQASGCI